MKIIEVLKEFPLIDKRIEKANELIGKYSAAVMIGTNVNLHFETVERQREEVNSLIQSVNDLVKRRADLRRQLAITNASVKVTIDGVERTITEWIDYREKGLQQQVSAFMQLKDTGAKAEMLSALKSNDISGGTNIIRFYDEAEKNTMLSNLLELKTKIDSTLEVVNATTDVQGQL